MSSLLLHSFLAFCPQSPSGPAASHLSGRSGGTPRPIALGYRRSPLERALSLFSPAPPESHRAFTGVMQFAMIYGGSVTVIYGFITCFVFGIAMALSMVR